MGKKPAAASAKDGKPSAKDKKAARKAEIAALQVGAPAFRSPPRAKKLLTCGVEFQAQSAVAKAAGAFDALSEFAELAKYSNGGLECSLESISGDAITPEFIDTLVALMTIEEERPAGGKGALAEAPTSFVVAKAGESIVGFTGYHAGTAEVPVIIADWIFVAGEVRRKGLGSHLVSILEKTATATELAGVQAAVPEAWPSTHDSLKFLWQKEWAKNPVQPSGKSNIQIVSHILDEAAMIILKAHYGLSSPPFHLNSPPIRLHFTSINPLLVPMDILHANANLLLPMGLI